MEDALITPPKHTVLKIWQSLLPSPFPAHPGEMGKGEVRNQKQTGFDSDPLLLLADESLHQICRRQKVECAFSIPEVAGTFIFITAAYLHRCFSTLAACSAVLRTVRVSVSSRAFHRLSFYIVLGQLDR